MIFEVVACATVVGFILYSAVMWFKTVRENRRRIKEHGYSEDDLWSDPGEWR